MKIGITIGDLNGIGPEVILKAIHRNKIIQKETLIVYGSSKALTFHKKTMDQLDINYVNTMDVESASHSKLNVINCWDEQVDIQLGKENSKMGNFAFLSLERAVKDLKRGVLDAIVTAPISKSAMDANQFPFPGHTEFLTKEFEVKESLMMLTNGDLRVALVTNHIPISEVSSKISKDLISQKLTILENSLIHDFGIDKPKIAVLGLNPHAGDGGKIGKEDDEMIKPIISDFKRKGSLVYGPYPADGFFGSSQYSKFDAILAMYHDQGLVPFKTLSFGKGVNYTAGLPIVRTSPDHGTGFDIAGKNIADPSSMRSAIYAAIDIYQTKKELKEMSAHAVERKKIESEAIEGDS